MRIQDRLHVRLKVLFVFLGTLVYISDLVLLGTIHVLHVSVVFFFYFQHYKTNSRQGIFQVKNKWLF